MSELNDGFLISSKDEDNGKMRKFVSGASRDSGEGKLQYDKFLSPLVLKVYAEYMHTKRVMPDGERSGDNWQKGIPKDAYMESLSRHYMDTWLIHRGYHGAVDDDIVTTLVGVMFNSMGMLHEVLKGQSEVPDEDTESWYEGEVDEEYIRSIVGVSK